MDDNDNRPITPEEANALHAKAAGAAIERDVAIIVAARASANEATAKEAASIQSVAARSAEVQASEMNTLRHVANARADQEAQSAETSRFGFYLLTGIILSAVVVVVIWLATRAPETNVSGPSGVYMPGQTGQTSTTPSSHQSTDGQ